MHHAVTTEAVGQKEAGNSSHGAEHAVVIRRHLIEPGPGALGVYRQILKRGNAVSGVDKDLFDERRFELGFIARRLFRIIPGEQEAAAFRTKVKTGAHVNDHRRSMWELGEGF